MEFWLFKSTNIFIFFYIMCVAESKDELTVQFIPSQLSMEIGDRSAVSITLSDVSVTDTVFVFTYMHSDTEVTYAQPHNHVIDALYNVTVNANETAAKFSVKAKSAGKVHVGVNTSIYDRFKNIEDVHLEVAVVHSEALGVAIIVVGWIYFLAWSFSFYPQVILNFTRKSVIGLNFDFLAYNLTGFIAYGLFNVGMYWIPAVKDEYMFQHHWGVNPVLLNDVVFTLHAIVITAFTICQCFIYERGGQRLSRICVALVAASGLFSIITLFIAIAGVITWLQYLYYFSYFKLGVTLIKYIPQARMNYRRKSTEGWSIGNVLLDMTGGSLSILQMFLLSYNNNDWGSIFGDPTKFGLGFFSILFDLLFIVQHYVLYRGNAPYTELASHIVEVSDEEDLPK